MRELALALVLLVAIAVGTGAAAGLGLVRSTLSAVARAGVQLAVVGLVIAAVFATAHLAPLYLGVVLMTAAITSGRRLGGEWTDIRRAAIAIAAGAGAAGAVVLVTAALPRQAQTVVPLLAQLTGGAMTATTMAGQRFLDDLQHSWGEYEAGLSLGLNPVEASRGFAQRAAVRALTPTLDQTRTVGLVTLPGAYVGMLLGGATPVEAGKVQLLVLVGLLAAQAVSTSVITRLMAPAWDAARPSAPLR